MLCYVMLCYVMLCYVMLCYVILSYLISSPLPEGLARIILWFTLLLGSLSFEAHRLLWLAPFFWFTLLYGSHYTMVHKELGLAVLSGSHTGKAHVYFRFTEYKGSQL